MAFPLFHGVFLIFAFVLLIIESVNSIGGSVPKLLILRAFRTFAFLKSVN